MKCMMTATELAETCLEWLRDHYASFTFYVERDVVWTIQTRMNKIIREKGLPFKVFNDFRMLRGDQRRRFADLVIRDTSDNTVALAMEFRYEPSHERDDIPHSKLPMVFWGDDGVGEDVKRIQSFVSPDSEFMDETRRARVAMSVFVDEGGAFAERSPHPGSQWEIWPGSVRVLRARADATEPEPAG
jgi:hypothetical protein